MSSIKEEKNESGRELKINVRNVDITTQAEILGGQDKMNNTRSFYYQERKKLAIANGMDFRAGVNSWKQGGGKLYRRLQYVLLLEAINNRNMAIFEARNKNINSGVFQNLMRDMKYNEILSEIVKGRQLDGKQAERLYEAISDSGAYLSFISVQGNQSVRPLNPATKAGIIMMFMSGFEMTEEVDVQGSDNMKDFIYEKMRKVTMVYKRIPLRPKTNTDGGFLNKINNSKFDLSKLQIFTQAQVNHISNMTHCLINSLKFNGIKDSKIQQVKLALSDKVNVPRAKLKEMAEIIHKNIILKCSDSSGRVKKIIYKTKPAYLKNKPCKIVIADNHYMPDIEFDISKYACDNYKDICELKNFQNITSKTTSGYNHNNKKYKKMTTLYVFNSFKNNGYFVKGDLKRFHEATTETEDLLEDIHNEQRPMKIKKSLMNKYMVFYADIESVTTRDDDVSEKTFENDDEVHMENYEQKPSIQLSTTQIEDLELFLNDEQQNSPRHDELTVITVKKSEPDFYDYGEDFETNETYGKCISKVVIKLEEDHKKRSDVLNLKNKDSKNINNEILMIGLISEYEKNVTIFNRVVNGDDYGEKATINDFLNRITLNGKQPALCYFHNLKYDFTILEKHLYFISVVKTGSILYSARCFHRGQIVEFRDSLKILNMALAKVPKNFNLDKEFRKMEAINYTYYNLKNVNKRCYLKDYVKGIKNSDKHIFDTQAKAHPTYDPKNDSFNPYIYYQDYLKLDCIVLMKGMKAFSKAIMTITESKIGQGDGLDVNESRTISSLTDKYLQINGAYNDVYEMSGNLRAYCSKAVFGGRVFVNVKYAKKLMSGEIADFDAVSLYPSAIVRLCEELGGIPTGNGTRFETGELSNWQSHKFSILTVIILKINKTRDVPRLAVRGKTKIEYVNEISNHKMVISNIGLENLIISHEVEFKVIDGIYWDEADPKMGELIKKLFQDRLTAKQGGKDALQQVIKLMLNSAYGKTIMKKSKVDFKIKSSYVKKDVKVSEFDTYFYNHFNTIHTARKMNDYQFEIKEVTTDTSFNRAHIGVFILDMSKRIVDEVLNILDDMDEPCYYGDTDSLHINQSAIIPLSDNFRNIYGRELIGTGLGQFHNDFSLNGVKKHKADIHSVKSIFLGKKSYMDIVKGATDDGEIKYDVHIKLKGITAAGIRHKVLNINESVNGKKCFGKMTNKYLALYELLASGEPVEFTLNPFIEEENSKNVMFEFTQDGVRLRDTCHRVVKF